MEDEAVKINGADTAADQNAGVETTNENAPDINDIDYESELAKKDAVIEKLSKERDNYKEGLLIAKGKKQSVDADEDTELSFEEIAERTVNQRLLKVEEDKVQKEKDDLIKQMAKDLKEAKLALKNKIGIATTGAGTGGNQDQEKGSPEFWSPEQLAVIKKKGLDPEKVKENFLKNKA